ncbi:hypothetical protein H4582DRAFT_2101535 [Lactarius indigo]|nr:hypothetical protein H4582DRAFT_2101535 [Lactarius indigo]
MAGAKEEQQMAVTKTAARTPASPQPQTQRQFQLQSQPFELQPQPPMDEAIADEDSPRRASPKRGAEHGDLQLVRPSSTSTHTSEYSSIFDSPPSLPGPAVGPSSQAHDHIVLPLEIPSGARHRYSLKSRGREYAVVVVASRADNELDSPLLHFGDGLFGYIKLGIDSLSDMLNMDVVLRL